MLVISGTGYNLMRLWFPAAASVIDRLADSWPRTSPKSTW